MELKKVYSEFINVNGKVVVAEAYIPTEYREGFPGLLSIKQGPLNTEDFDSVSWDVPQIHSFDNESAIIRLAIKTLDETVKKLEAELKVIHATT